MNKIDEILDRLQQAQQPTIDAPDELTECIMSSLPERGTKSTARTVRLYWRSAVAACLLALFGAGATLLFNQQETTSQPTAQQQVKSTAAVRDTTEMVNEVIALQATEDQSEKTTYTANVQNAQSSNAHYTQPVYEAETSLKEQDTKAVGRPGPIVKDEKLHYASLETEDTTYQAPSLVDDFIAKLAEFNNVRPKALQCGGDSTDMRTTSRAYVFTDAQEMDIFGRLLLVAVTYDQKAPGYQLNISNNQLVFQLHDKHKNMKYLWMAERIGGQRILLYITQSPINVPLSTACYQDFRDELTHTGKAYQQI